MGDPGEEISGVEHRVTFAIEEEVYHFHMKRGLSIDWGFSLVVTKARTTSGIRASQIHRRIVYRFQEHW